MGIRLRIRTLEMKEELKDSFTYLPHVGQNQLGKLINWAFSEPHSFETCDNPKYLPMFFGDLIISFVYIWEQYVTAWKHLNLILAKT